MVSKSVVPADVKDSLQTAASNGFISSQTSNAIVEQLDDIALAGCQGVDIDDIDSEEVTLATVVIDASESMRPYRKDVIKAYNEVFLDPLRKSKNAASILVSAWVFSDDGGQEMVRLIYSHTPIPDCKELTMNDYNPGGSTPLYDAVFKGMTGLVTYGQTLRNNGTRTKSIMVVLSDGMENASRTSGSKVRRFSADVLRAYEFTLASIYFGSGDEQQTQMEAVTMAKDIGFPEHNLLSEKAGASAIRRLLGQVSASVITTSQSVVSSQNPFFNSV